MNTASWLKTTRAFLVYGVTVAVLEALLAILILLFGQFEGSRELITLCVFPYLVAFCIWAASTRRLLDSLNDNPRQFQRHPLFIAAIGLLVLTFVLDRFLSGGSALGFANRVLSIAADVCLLLVVRHLRDRVQGITSGQITPDLAAARAPILPNTDRYDVLPSAAEVSEEFWVSVARLAATQDVVLLETSPAMARRWIVIPAGGDITAASIKPGTILTLFPAVTTPPASAPEYYGLIQSTPTGPVRFQLVLPSRVSDFEIQSRTAARAALYSPNDPAAVAVAVAS